MNHKGVEYTVVAGPDLTRTKIKTPSMNSTRPVWPERRCAERSGPHLSP